MGCVMVKEDKVAVLEKFGKFQKIASPGFHCLPLPCICTSAGELNLRIQSCVVHTQSRTSDSVFATVETLVNFCPVETEYTNAFYKLSNPIGQSVIFYRINSYVDDAVRTFTPTKDLDTLYLSTKEFAQHVYGEISDELRSFGWRIVSVLIINIQVDAKIRDSMNEVHSNYFLRLANQENVEAHKTTLELLAEAECEKAALYGEGISGQRKCITEGLSQSLDHMNELGLESKDIADLLLSTQYFDTLKNVVGSTTKIIFTHKKTPMDRTIQQFAKAN